MKLVQKSYGEGGSEQSVHSFLLLFLTEIFQELSSQ